MRICKMMKKTYFNIYNFLRGIGALSVLIFHTAWLCSVYAPSINNIPFPFYMPAWGAVWMFFMISGYLLGKAFVSGRYKVDTIEDIGRFYLSRAIRILPIYYFVFFIDLFFVNTPLYLSFDNHLLVKCLLLSITPTSTTGMIGNLWFVCTIIRLYLLTPVIYVVIIKIREKCNHKRLFCLGILFLLCSVSFYFRFSLLGKQNWSDFIYSKWFFNLDFYGGGIILSLLFTNDKESSLKRIMRFVSLGLFFVFLVYESFCMKKHWMLDVGAEDLKVYAPCILFFLIALILWSFSSEVQRNRETVLEKRERSFIWRGLCMIFSLPVYFIVFCGKISMGMYVSHSQTISNLLQRFSHQTDKTFVILGNTIIITSEVKNFSAILIFALVFSFIWGCIVHYMLERPLDILRSIYKDEDKD